MRRRSAAILAVLLVVAVAVVVLVRRDGSPGPESAAPSAAETRAALKGSPAPLAALHAQASRILDGGTSAFAARLRRLRGHPVVVNKWGSWCPPCRAEFPYFQRQAVRHGRRVAFLGVDGEDSRADAERFLERYPVAYPSYYDPDSEIAEDISAVGNFPATVFYDAEGEIAHVRQGGYRTEADLAADIERYAR